MFRRFLVALLLVVVGCSPAAARKVALVIGNGAYKSTVALTNPVQDARAMAGKLEGLGFEVVSGYDEDLVAMQGTVSEFARKVIGADVALLFYAGHGIQVRGDNYLIPIDAKFEDETSLDFETVPVNFIMRQMSRDVRVRLIILDACRNNPLSRSLARAMGPSRSASVAEGLAEIKIEDPGEGTVIAFATSPGDVAYDGDSSHSPFTEALLKHIDTPNTPIQNVLTRVTRDVYEATKQRQRPWVNASLIGEVYLNETAAPAQQVVADAGGAAAPDTPAAPALAEAPKPADASLAWDREKTLFEVAAKTGAVEDYRAYLAAYPEGQFAAIARNYITRSVSPAAKEPTLTIAALPPADTAAAPAAEPSAPAVPAAAAAPEAESPTVAPDAATHAPGTESSEDALGWDKAKRREVQMRLEISGQEIGTPDGSFGPRTRAAVSSWQTANGFEASGFFTAEQFDLLASQTEAAYERWKDAEARQPAEASQPEASKKADSTGTSSAPKKKATAAKKTTPTKKSASTPPKKQTAAVKQRPPAKVQAPKPQIAEQAPFGSAYSRSTDTHCLAHPGHRVTLDGVCMY
jgi:uncharacterized caspase-like protein